LKYKFLSNFQGIVASRIYENLLSGVQITLHLHGKLNKIIVIRIIRFFIQSIKNDIGIIFNIYYIHIYIHIQVYNVLILLHYFFIKLCFD
jgi:hypothetical protein